MIDPASRRLANIAVRVVSLAQAFRDAGLRAIAAELAAIGSEIVDEAQQASDAESALRHQADEPTSGVIDLNAYRARGDLAISKKDMA